MNQDIKKVLSGELSWSVITGNCVELLKELPDKSIQCVVTSPPYWGQRDYGIEPSIWGGLDDCDHNWKTERIYDRGGGSTGQGGGAFTKPGKANAQRLKDGRWRDNTWCDRCDAWSGVFGLEPTVDLFIENTVRIFNQVWRVLKDDGTLWVNIGDKYNGSGGAGGDYRPGGLKEKKIGTDPLRSDVAGLKPKDLIGLPWLSAFALRSAGWYLRSEIIWHKLSAMPQSPPDRPSTAHEQLFLFTKEAKQQFWTHRELPGQRTEPKPDFIWKYSNGTEVDEAPPGWVSKIADCECHHGDDTLHPIRKNLWVSHGYFYDLDATRVPFAESSVKRLTQPNATSNQGGESDYSKTGDNGGNSAAKTVRNMAAKYQRSEAWDDRHEGWKDVDPAQGANLRSVWSPAQENFSGAHPATYPPGLVTPCIQAGTSSDGECPECGLAWWHGRATCKHVDSDPRKQIVLDIFNGAGTTGLVATRMGRSYIGFELSPEYSETARTRIAGAVGIESPDQVDDLNNQPIQRSML